MMATRRTYSGNTVSTRHDAGENTIVVAEGDGVAAVAFVEGGSESDVEDVLEDIRDEVAYVYGGFR